MTAKHRTDRALGTDWCIAILGHNGIGPGPSANPRRPRRTGVHVDTLIKRSHYLATDALARVRMETT